MKQIQQKKRCENMTFLIFSDSHGNTSEMISIINSEPEVNAIFHAGDYISDANSLMCTFPNIPVYCVCGNCDFGSTGKDEDIIEIAGKRIFITHGHKYNVKMTTRDIYYKTIEGDFDLTIFGHTHEKMIDYAGKGILLNPGAISGYGKSYAKVTLDGKKLVPEIIPLQKEFF